MARVKLEAGRRPTWLAFPVAGGRLHHEVRAPLRPDGRSPLGVDAPIAEGRSPFHGLIHEQIAVRKMRWRRKKIAGAFWSLHVSLHDGKDELACHVSEIGKKSVTSFVGEWQTLRIVNGEVISIKMAYSKYLLNKNTTSVHCWLI
jgi:hypothetical protein